MKFFTLIIVFVIRYIFSNIKNIILKNKENLLKNITLNDNSSSNDFLYIYTEANDSEQGEYASIRTEKINDKLFYSIENSKKNAIIIPKDYLSSIETFNINLDCKFNCQFSFNYLFNKKISIKEEEYFWFNTIPNINYKFEIHFNSNYIFCFKTTYTNLDDLDELYFTKVNYLEMLNISEINCLCLYSYRNNIINFEFKIPENDYIFIYFQENNNLIKESIYSPVYFYYFNKIISFDDSSSSSSSSSSSNSNSGCNSDLGNPGRAERRNLEEGYSSDIYSNSNSYSDDSSNYENNNKYLTYEPIDNTKKYSILFDLLSDNDIILNDKKYYIYYNNFFINKTGTMEFKFTDMENKLIVFQFLLIHDTYQFNILHKLYFDKILKDRLINNEIRFYRQGKFSEDFDKYIFKVNKIEGDIHVYIDICNSYPNCNYSNYYFENMKEKNKNDFTEIYEISNIFSYIINSKNDKRTKIINTTLLIVECISEVCVYNVSLEYVYEDKKLILDKFFNLYNTKDNTDKYYIDLNKGFYLLNILTIFGKVNFSLNNCDINNKIIYLNYIIINFQSKSNNNKCILEITLLEDSFYYLIINQLPSEDSSIIIPGIKNLISIHNNYHHLYFPTNYKPNEQCNIKVIFKPINDKLKITINDTDYEDEEYNNELHYSYNNLYIHSFDYCDYDDEINYIVECQSNKNCLYFLTIEDNNNIVLSPNYIDYFILDNEINNVNLLIPISIEKKTYYFNYLYNQEDLNIYQILSGDFSNLTINTIHNKFILDIECCRDDNINNKYYYFYIKIFKNNIESNKEYLLEFNLKTNPNSYYPTFLYFNEIYYDFFDDINKLHYIINLKNNIEGSFYYQIQKGCGKIIGMIKQINFTSENITDVANFEDKDNDQLLKFDRYNQKITFKTSENCNDFINNIYCFLVLRITFDVKYNNNINFTFTLMSRINNEATYIKPEINIIGNLNKRIEEEHLYEFYISKNLHNFYIIFSSNNGIIEVLNETYKMDMGEESKIIPINEDFNYNKIIEIKISSKFQKYDSINYKIEISSNAQTIPIICNGIYDENEYIFNFYDNSYFQNNITCFSNCEYCKIQQYNIYSNLKCVNCPPPFLTILYDNQHINQTKCLEFCTIDYFYYKNRTCKKVENYLDYCFENNVTYRGLNFSSILYYYNNYSFDKPETIDLKECLNVINEKYEIDNNDSLIIYLASIDMLKHQVTKQVEYLIFTPNGTKVDLNICENTSIIVSTYVDLSKTDLNLDNMYYLFSQGYDIFNSSESFYLDVCIHFTSENSSTDISMEDRKKLFYINIKFCEEGCNYTGFNIDTFKVNCSCPVKKKTSAIERIFVENNVNEDFKEKITSSNLKVLKCLNLLNKDIFKYNVGFYIVFIGIIIEAILTYYYYKLGIYNVVKLIENYKYDTLSNKKYNEKVSKFKSTKKKSSSKISNNSLNKSYSLNPPLKKEKPKNKNKINQSFKFNFEEKETNSFKDKKEYDKLFKKQSIQGIEKINKLLKFSNEQLNEMNYEDSLKYDNRNILQIYYSFLMYSQLIIFSFLNNTDYNVKVLKIQLFVFAIIIFIVFNTLFYSDKDVSHTYQNQGKFDILYTLPKTIFSSVISAVINFILKFLSLSNEKIKQLANIKNIKLFQKKLCLEIQIIKRKIFMFHILIFLFTLFFWFYITLFCAVYRNSQIIVFKSCIITFCLSMFYPFIICFATSVFRLFALSHEFKPIFYISKILQLF